MLDIGVAWLLVCVAAVLWYYHKCNVESKRYGTLPSVPYPVPLLGHLPFLGKLLHKTFVEWSKKYGNIFRIQMGNRPAIAVNGRDDVKKITDMLECSGRPDLPTWDNLQNFFTFDYRSDALKCRKKVIQAMSALKDYSFDDTVDKCCEELISKWKTTKSSGWMYDLATANSKVMFILCYGEGDAKECEDDVNTLVRVNDGFGQAVHVMNLANSLPWLLKIHPYVKKVFKEFLVRLDVNHTLATRQIEKHINQAANDNSDDVDNILDALRTVSTANTDGKVFDRRFLMHQVQTVLGAALDTTAATLIWSIIFFCKYPEHQTALWEELSSTADVTQLVGEEQTIKLILMEAFINEVLRYVTPVPFAIPHRATKDVVLENNMIIPKDTFLFINLWSVNHDEKVWRSPKKFQPERFIKDGALDKEMLANMMSFSHGRRRCVGEVTARKVLPLFLANLLRRCEFSFADESKNVDIDDMIMSLTLRPPDVKITVKPRKFLFATP